MIKRSDNIKLPVDKPESELIKFAEKQLKAKVKYFKILKKSLDARDKQNVFWLYSIAYSKDEEREIEKPLSKINNAPQVAVVGAGPAGLFCALRLIERGFCPVIIERGEPVEIRRADTQKFFSTGILKNNSNVQFGEGGAGAFSDGKLITRTKDGANAEVLKLFVKFGAPEEILYLNKPHVGSDRLFGVLQNIRSYITANGGRYMFSSALVGIEKRGGELTALKIENVNTKDITVLPVDCAVVAVGHSSRDTFKMLWQSGVAMEAREFAIGVRIEHLSREISRAQYGAAAKYLPAADYSLVSHADERTVFTFCMCPGGVVIPAASEEGGVVVNGMSDYLRNGENSNSALMVQLHKSDFGADDLFAGVRFLCALEQKAYALGGGGYKAPVQLYGDFAKDRLSSSFGDIRPTYAAGTSFAPLSELLPAVVIRALKAAVPDMARRLKGFDNPYALLTGVESRFSSPIKMLRGESRQSITVPNLYPCGEGSGYSGGITSSAADGIATAEAIYERFLDK